MDPRYSGRRLVNEAAMNISGDSNSKLIAIIDDDENMQDSLRDLMEAAGMAGRSFGSAEEFLQSECTSRRPI